MAIKITVPGALVTVQDAGRSGYQGMGIGTSGVMDMCAYHKANNLAGNEPGAAVLEAALFGGTMEFTEDSVIAITGAAMEPKINGRDAAMYTPLEIKAGDILSLSMVKEGCRTYLAVAGGIDVPVVMGSRSTNLKCGIGGYKGRALKAGDELPIGEDRKTFAQLKGRTEEPDHYPSKISVRVVEGPQADYFTDKGKRTFYSEEYTVSAESDRMGCRLEGEKVESIEGTDIVSDAVPFGAVQIPAGGKPIILLADRQTTGGYAKIAVVCSFDLPRLAQVKPGDKVRFEQISLEQAEKINRRKGN